MHVAKAFSLQPLGTGFLLLKKINYLNGTMLTMFTSIFKTIRRISDLEKYNVFLDIIVECRTKMERHSAILKAFGENPAIIIIIIIINIITASYSIAKIEILY